mmetsp:Transcript_1825/g.4227  ORF Transcript_1825/g.4227 Transcript_1825/m.4227 type:complete len:713 (-) Transcript_1825:56-2194(-)
MTTLVLLMLLIFMMMKTTIAASGRASMAMATTTATLSSSSSFVRYCRRTYPVTAAFVSSSPSYACSSVRLQHRGRSRGLDPVQAPASFLGDSDADRRNHDILTKRSFNVNKNIHDVCGISRRMIHGNRDGDGRVEETARLWHGDTEPFSEHADHVRVSEEDTPVDLCTAVYKSLWTIGVETERKLVIKDTDDDLGGDMSSSTTATRTRNLADATPPYTPLELLEMGALWYLPAKEHQHNSNVTQQLQQQQQQQDEAGGDDNSTKTAKAKARAGSVALYKPKRLTLKNISSTSLLELQAGDYFRIHHTPRRFKEVYEKNWTKPMSLSSSSSSSSISSVTTENNAIVDVGDGYVVLDKPALVPVHATVDNGVENVIYRLEHCNPTTNINMQEEQLLEPYFAPVQRLDINTSGLFVVATEPDFARYMADQLRRKTSSLTDISAPTKSNTSSLPSSLVEKTYRCLVCLSDSDEESAAEGWERLSKLTCHDVPLHAQDDDRTSDESGARSLQNDGPIVRHYLKVSDKAPKEFTGTIPQLDNKEDRNQWLECLLQIISVSEPINIYHDDKEEDGINGDRSRPSLASALWPSQKSSQVPSNTKAVAEVQIRLLTGRTHQVRGQLSALGFPIVGDEQYGGAISCSLSSSSKADNNCIQGTTSSSQLLALQCCRLGFYEPDYEAVWNRRKRRDIVQGRPSQRWSEYSLDEAWWTPHITNSQ